MKTLGKFLSPLPVWNPDHGFIQIPFRGIFPLKINYKSPYEKLDMQEPGSVVW